MVMEQIIENDDLYRGCIENRHVGVLKRKAKNETKGKQCNQCNYSFSNAGNLRRHLLKHSGVKSNKCNQCDYASIYKSQLKTSA